MIGLSLIVMLRRSMRVLKPVRLTLKTGWSLLSTVILSTVRHFFIDCLIVWIILSEFAFFQAAFGGDIVHCAGVVARKMLSMSGQIKGL